MKIDYFIVGGQKTGSTSLFSWLRSSGQFCTHSQSEMSYFIHDHEKNLGINKAFSDYFGDANCSSKPVLAKHAMACYFKDALKGIYQHNNDVKIIFILRDPIARAYSAYWYARQMGWEPEKSFANAVEKEAERMQDYYVNRNICYLFNSRFDLHLEAIKSIFPRENLLVLTERDIRNSGQLALKKISEAYGIKFPANFGLQNSDKNKGGLPRSEIISRAISYISNPNSLPKRILSPFFSAKSRSNLLLLLRRLNSSSNPYPKISKIERSLVADRLKPALELYFAYESSQSDV